MNNLERRIERLEQEKSAERFCFIWIEPEESTDDALRRSRPLAGGETPLFVGWQ